MLTVIAIVDGALVRMPVRKCNSCLKEYSCRQTLFVHKKKCKGRHQYPEMYNPSQDRKVSCSLKEFMSMLDDIKNDRSVGDSLKKILSMLDESRKRECTMKERESL